MAYFPLALVVLSAALSATYKHCSRRKLTSSARCMLVASHAFATEILQLCILGTGIVVGWGFFASKTIMLDIYIISRLDFPVPVWFLATMTVSGYLLALFAIDLIDNRIQLGCWTHPVQTQTLLLTRSLLAPGSLWTIRQRRGATKHVKRPSRKGGNRKKKVDPVTTTPYRRQRTTSEPVTPEMLRRFLREISVEVSKSGALIREARKSARRSSAAASLMTPKRGAGDDTGILRRTPGSMGLDKKYEVQSKVEVIERVVGKRRRSESMVLPKASTTAASSLA